MRRWRAARSKSGVPHTISADELPEYEFVAAPRRMCAWLLVDIDRPTGVFDVYEIARELDIEPGWVIETSGGRAQIGVLVDPVDMRPTQRTGAQRYVAAVGRALRSAFDGDVAVDPVTPVRMRNPLYAHADVHRAPAPRQYRLRELHDALAAAGCWETEPHRRRGESPAASVPADPGGVIPAGERNMRVFDACRFAAYRGEDHRAAAWHAFERCEQTESRPRFTEREVEGIIASVEKFMAGTRPRRAATTASTSMPEPMREALAEMGRRGGSRNSSAQREARAKGQVRGAAAVRARSAARAEKARELAAQGRSQREIAETIGVSIATVSRALRTPAEPSPTLCKPGASGVRVSAASQPESPALSDPEWAALGDREADLWEELADLAPVRRSGGEEPLTQETG